MLPASPPSATPAQLGAVPGGPEIVIVFLSVVFPLLVAGWVFRDATRRGWPLAVRVAVAAAVAGSSLLVVVIGPLAAAAGYLALTRR